MKVAAQLLTVSKNKDQEAILTFACSLDVLQKIETLVDEVPVIFYIEGAESDKIRGYVTGTSASVSSADMYKFKIKCPGSENLQTGQLSTLCGQELNLVIDVDHSV